MASIPYDAEDIIVDFLRRRLIDPRNRAETTRTESLTTLDNGQTDFDLTPTSGKVSTITSVSVDSVSKTKWVDYYFHPRDQKLIFFNGLNAGEVVAPTYKQGTDNWIYTDKNSKKLGADSFPRISVKLITGGGMRLGNFEAPVESAPQFQIDVWVREVDTSSGNQDELYLIGGIQYGGEKLARYLGNQAFQAFEDNEGDLHPVMYEFIPVSIPRSIPFDIENQNHRRSFDFIIKTLNIGRLKTN